MRTDSSALPSAGRVTAGEGFRFESQTYTDPSGGTATLHRGRGALKEGGETDRHLPSPSGVFEDGECGS